MGDIKSQWTDGVGPSEVWMGGPDPTFSNNKSPPQPAHGDDGIVDCLSTGSCQQNLKRMMGRVRGTGRRAYSRCPGLGAWL